MRHFALAAVALAGLAGDAAANGRPPATSTIHFRQGHDTDIVAGMTFGMVISHDGGATWQWMCEAAVGYAGMYDPDYAYTSTGALFATTFNGLVANRDSCTFAATTFGTTFISQVELGPDMALYAAAADPNDAKIYKSTNDGMVFNTGASPGLNNDWWQTLIIAPGNASDVFLSGYRYVPACDMNSPQPFKSCSTTNMNADCIDSTHPNGMCENQRVALLFKSTNGGSSFSPLPGNGEFLTQTTDVGLTTTANSALDFVGTSSDGATLYARVEQESSTGEGLYKIDTGTGTTWTHLLSVNDNIAALVRANGDVVVGTRSSGSQVSNNGGTSWKALTNPPHINCLAENAAGEVWACTQQIGNANAPSDGYGIMKSTDLATWTGVLRYADIQEPVSCAAGTPQHDTCQAQIWCGLKQQLGITSTVIACASGSADGPPDAGTVVKPPGKGCCDTGGSGAQSAVLVGIVATLLARRRRTRLS